MSPEILEDVHWQPNRVEWLVNAISELTIELDELEQQKLKYEYELDQLVKEE